jgi:hypothetical protein
MGAFVVVIVQVVLAVLVAGLLLPAILFAVPATQNAGPVVMALAVALLFILLRVAWPRAK